MNAREALPGARCVTRTVFTFCIGLWRARRHRHMIEVRHVIEVHRINAAQRIEQLLEFNGEGPRSQGMALRPATC